MGQFINTIFHMHLGCEPCGSSGGRLCGQFMDEAFEMLDIPFLIHTGNNNLEHGERTDGETVDSPG